MTESPSDAAEMSAGADSSAPTIAWIGPFVVFLAWLLLDRYVPLANPAKEILRDAIILASIVGFSRRLIPTSAPHWLSSITIGVAVCALWVAPDVLIPGWRSHSIFQNAVTGHVTVSIEPPELTPLMLILRTTRAVLLVPVLEELFWRGWLPRFLQHADFRRVPLGQYTSFAFWTTAALFAAEHGPFWEVGLVTGVVYNWWMRRTRSLGDLVLCHATTNLALSLFVIVTKRWGFWM
jgi:CAAX prenyl protease-like protein